MGGSENNNPNNFWRNVFVSWHISNPQCSGRALGSSPVSALPSLPCIQANTRAHLWMLQHEMYSFFKVLQVHIIQKFREVSKFEISQSKHSKTMSSQEAGLVFTKATTTSKQIDDPREGSHTWKAQVIRSFRLSKDILEFQILAVSKEKFLKPGRLRVEEQVEKRTLLKCGFFFFLIVTFREKGGGNKIFSLEFFT